jgi:hypothetical protein
MRALADSQSLTKLKFMNCERMFGVQNYDESFNLNVFSNLTSLFLHGVTAPYSLSANVTHVLISLLLAGFGKPDPPDRERCRRLCGAYRALLGFRGRVARGVRS